MRSQLASCAQSANTMPMVLDDDKDGSMISNGNLKEFFPKMMSKLRQLLVDLMASWKKGSDLSWPGRGYWTAVLYLPATFISKHQQPFGVADLCTSHASQFNITVCWRYMLAVPPNKNLKTSALLSISISMSTFVFVHRRWSRCAGQGLQIT